MADKHVVQQGECILSIAAASGHADWKKIWDAPENAELKKKRPNPHILMPGDEVFVPPVRHKVKANQKTKLEFAPPKAFLRVKLVDGQHKAIAGRKYELKIGDKTLTGTTGNDGLVEQEVPAHEVQAELHFTDDPNGAPMIFLLGHLDPIDELSGIQGRLTNLGFPCRHELGELGPATEQALRAFQRAHKLKETGELDDDTRKELKDKHGG